MPGDPPTWQGLQSMVEHNLREMQRTDLTDDELQQAKILLLRQLPLSEASTDGIAGGLLSRSLSESAAQRAIHAAERYRETTAEQVRKAFAKWIRPRALSRSRWGRTLSRFLMKRCVILGSIPPDKNGPELASASASDTLWCSRGPGVGSDEPGGGCPPEEDGYNEVIRATRAPSRQISRKILGACRRGCSNLSWSCRRPPEILDLAVVSALLVSMPYWSFAPGASAARRRRNAAATIAGQRPRTRATLVGRLSLPGSWFPATSSAYAPATSFRQT